MGAIARGAIARVGADLAKRAIQVHAVDAAGRRVLARPLKRDQFIAWCATLPPGCLVVMRACLAGVNRIRGVLAEFGLVFGKSTKMLRAVPCSRGG